MDVGQPKDFLTGTTLYLNHVRHTRPDQLAPADKRFVGNVLMDPTYAFNALLLIDRHCCCCRPPSLLRFALLSRGACLSAQVAEGALVGPNVVLGPNSVIESGARLANTTVLEGATVKAHAWIKNSIIGWHSSVGTYCSLTGAIFWFRFI